MFKEKKLFKENNCEFQMSFIVYDIHEMMSRKKMNETFPHRFREIIKNFGISTVAIGHCRIRVFEKMLFKYCRMLIN
jgi:hypothetical protein